MPDIYILSGPVRSGKTTWLKQWNTDRANVCGLLAPVINGKRYIKNIRSGEMRLLEAEHAETGRPLIYIGKFSFFEDTFEWGRHILYECLPANNVWIVIDEIGPLELQGKGLEPAVSYVLGNAGSRARVILVIRHKLLDAVLQHYGFNKENISFFNFEEKTE